KTLLREEKYTIEGAKKVLEEYVPEPDNGEQLELLTVAPRKKIQDEEIRADLMQVREFLEGLLAKMK
ncbi:MAG: Transcriptional regulator, partial [Bacteroidetes bacterium]|nr:Transcriptional regulator [Bacteroidota bacterium]